MLEILVRQKRLTGSRSLSSLDGLTRGHHAAEHPDVLPLAEYYGAVDTTWVVYGAHKRFQGAVGQPPLWLSHV